MLNKTFRVSLCVPSIEEGKSQDRLDSSALVGQLILEKETFEFKPIALHWNIDIVSQPAGGGDEGFKNINAFT